MSGFDDVPDTKGAASAADARMKAHPAFAAFSSGNGPITALLRTMATVQAVAQRYRRPILIAAVGGFAIVTVAAFRSLDLSFGDLDPLGLAALAVLAVMSMIYSAASMMLLGHASTVRISLISGIRINSLAQMAELLPVPGGAIVRTGALLKGGAGAKRSAELVLTASLLWVGMAAIAASIALAPLHPGVWVGTLFAIAMTGALTAWLGRRYGWGFACGSVGLRLIGISLTAARLFIAFLVIGKTIEPLSSFIFAFASIAGTASSIVPTGLGVGEGLAALLAIPTGIDPAAAFLATGLSRIVGLAVNCAFATMFCLGVDHGRT